MGTLLVFSVFMASEEVHRQDFMHVHMCMCICMCLYAYVYACEYMYMHVLYMHMHVHMYLHEYVHMHLHKHVCLCFWLSTPCYEPFIIGEWRQDSPLQGNPFQSHKIYLQHAHIQACSVMNLLTQVIGGGIPHFGEAPCSLAKSIYSTPIYGHESGRTNIHTYTHTSSLLPNLQ